MAIEVFNRVEKKYMMDANTYEKFVTEIEEYMNTDIHCNDGKFYTICNIYYDTVNDDLIRNSIEKPAYKEKMRLRSYGVVGMQNQVFLEIKKKYRGIVNKRRTVLKLEEAYEFINKNKRPDPNEYINEQVLDELDYFIDFYKPLPKLFLAYDRRAYFGKDDPELRITFDTNIRTRRNNVGLEVSDEGELLLDKDIWLMEIKTVGAIPLWLTEKLTKYNIMGCSFSKYGTEYKKMLNKKLDSKNNTNGD